LLIVSAIVFFTLWAKEAWYPKFEINLICVQI